MKAARRIITMNNKSEYRLETINNLMSLRLPQYKSLQILDKIAKELFEIKDDKILENKIHEMFPIFKNFERAFPSFAFSLATGVGKTLLMGAFITYLYTNYDIRNFFIVAPNLTIYNKLIEDFGSPNSKKYVFKRIQEFAQNPPTVITGETYKDEIAGQTILNHSITINIFNIGKINAEVRGGKLPQIKRLAEYLGESYFDYLSGLNDLVVLMDESHHYRADRGMTVINELKPLLGLELTATPQVEKSNKSIKFKNVVYEYSLARAIVDGYVKQPAVATRKDFDPRKFSNDEIDKIKLNDGIRIHQNTKTELELYSKNEGVKLVKPFVLVVCKDTNHAEEVKEYITSDEFFNGYYKDKVLEVHSNQKGSEKDENIQKLMSLEDPENNIEIVIHVNMLKEGWDVTNLYTIIPLRTSASLTLREQTIGRGLRLPYGSRTGNDTVDRLTIIAHDKFEEIVNAANDESSIIKKENIISIEDENIEEEKEVKVAKTVFDNIIEQKKQKLKYARSEEKKQDLKEEIAIDEAVGKTINEVIGTPIDLKIATVGVDDTLSKHTNKVIKTIITSHDLERPEVKKIIKEKAKEKLQIEGQQSFKDIDKIEERIEQAVSPLCEQKIRYSIDIPDVVMVSKDSKLKKFNQFKLDTFGLRFKVPSDEIIIETLGDKSSSILKLDENVILPDTPENVILNEILNQSSDVNYKEHSELIYNLIGQALDEIKQNKSKKDLCKIVFKYKKDIAYQIYNQMKLHCEISAPEYDVKILKSSSEILPHGYTKYKQDDIKEYTSKFAGYEVKSKVFDYFSKACHTEYKFDSVPEQIFSIVLERDSNVLKWLRPAQNQLKIICKDGRQYTPDFLVETDKNIYIIEIKSYKRILDEEVKLKAISAQKYCEYVNIYAKEYSKKPFSYIIIPAEEISRSSSFDALLNKNYLYKI